MHTPRSGHLLWLWAKGGADTDFDNFLWPLWVVSGRTVFYAVLVAGRKNSHGMSGADHAFDASSTVQCGL